LKKILIIEDEKPLARALELKLTFSGFEVKTAYNGENILPLIEKENFDLIVCDLVMPRVDGFQVLQMLKEKGIKTSVIILTNLSQEEDEKRARSLGAADFFIKSNTPIATVVKKIEELLKDKN
jgi:DNA-binding response OmpR family regulator